RLSLEKLQREKQAVFVLVDFVQLTNVGVTDAGAGPRFPPQALPLLLVADLLAYAFDCDGPVQTVVVRGIDDAHSPLAQLAGDSVSTDCLQISASLGSPAI